MKVTSLFKKTNVFFASFLLILFYLSEGVSKYSILFADGKLDAPRVIKLLVVVILCIGLLRVSISVFKHLLLLAVSFTLGQFFLTHGFQKEVVVSFSKFLFPILLFLYFWKFPLSKQQRQTLFKVFEWLLLFNCVLVFVGFLFELPWFSTYRTRFGYNGLLITSATSSYVHVIALFYFLITRKTRFFSEWKSLAVILSSFLIGTKAVYLGLFVVFIAYLFYYTHLPQKLKKIVILTALLGAVGTFYIFFFYTGFFDNLRQTEGLLSSVLSLRNDLLMEETLPFIQENWSWGNYLFGGITEMETRSQMGVIDVFYFWGLVGGALYVYTFVKTFVTFRLTKEVLFLLISFAVIVFLAGNFFENASVAIYLLVLREAFLYNTKKETANNSISP